MGVQGWTRLLAEEGWLPFLVGKKDNTTNKKSQKLNLQEINRKTSLWMNPDDVVFQKKSHHLLEDRMVQIPAGSEIHIDGFCLCFHIHSVAYARHCQRVLSTTPKKCRHNTSKWKPEQVRHMIPSFLPPGLLTQVTSEFVNVLREEYKMKILVYWDGGARYAPPSISRSHQHDDSDDDDEEESDNNDDEIWEDDDGDMMMGPAAPASFKHETQLFRQAQRVEEWSVLQDYCVHGKIPTGVALQRWEKEFPKNRIFIGQIMHTLYQLQTPMKFCDEEADPIMARTVATTNNNNSMANDDAAFILGMDSDFCFFPNAPYIPITTLTRVQKSKCLKAVVMRRDILAESLGIPDQAMVELAILMGNDYVSGIERLDLPVRHHNDSSTNNNNKDAAALPRNKELRQRNPYLRTPFLLELLHQQGEGYQVQSNDPHTQQCLHFVRKLYNLQDMSDYEMEKPVLGLEPSLLPAAIGMTVELSSAFKNATIDPSKGDTCLQDAVVRYLQMILRHQQESHIALMAAEEDGTILPPKVLTQSHIQAFQMLSIQRPPYSEIDQEIQDPQNWRPLWRDVPAAYWIERLTNAIMHNVIEQYHRSHVVVNIGGRVPTTALMNGIVSPGEVFDPYLYHAYLRVAREAHTSSVEESRHREEVVATSNGEGPQLQSDETTTSREVPKLQLPVDEFQETILQSVQNNRVTIIQGDTGCGKSSRIPVMLLKAPSPNPFQTETKLFISQPRRIAAKALVERLRSVEPELRGQIALRLGHGVREYETNETRAWFVTTGYLVRLLANHPERFDDISVLIIDEVHERSVDTDILCLLCRRLLETNEHIRLVLMSATLAADMYREYFSVPEPPIRVGARRFPVKEVYLDDLNREFRLSSKDARKAIELLNQCIAMKCKTAPPLQYMEKLYSVVANLATVVAKPGSSVLIFVPGMNEIVAITEQIESITIPGVRFNCVPIHSDIPFEDQMLVFDASSDDEVKVVIATNAAESSLTLPEVDNVICLGLCKQIVYNQTSHRQMLTPTWISRASATQRSGRTGRVRPGTVYRMYSRQNFESDMDAFEPGEILRIPLDSVILMLKEMLSEEEVSEVLLTCLEPPDISAIDRSFDSLFKSHFITAPDDSCELTNLGAFVSSLGIDLGLGSLIGLGIQMGVGAEAIQMAAVLSFPKSPWVMSNPLVHPTASFNENTCRSYVSKSHFDSNIFSEPMAVMNLVWDYEHLEDRKDLQKWCKFHNIFLPRIKRLLSTTVNLRKRVADYLGIAENLLEVERPPSHMTHGMITILRVIQVWVFHETMIQFDQKSLEKIQKTYRAEGGGYRAAGPCLDIQTRSDNIERKHLEQILINDRHPFSLHGSSEIRLKGSFEFIPVCVSDDANHFVTRLETHILSYATEKQFFGFVCISLQNSLSVYTISESATENDVISCFEAHREPDSRVLLRAVSNEGKSIRGIGERACGLWSVEESPTKAKANETVSVMWTRNRFDLSSQLPKETASTKKQKKKRNSAKREFQSISNSLEKLGRSLDQRCIVLHLPFMIDEITPNESFNFILVSFGTTNAVNDVDIKDLLGPRFHYTKKEIPGRQRLRFSQCENKPREFKSGKAEAPFEASSSWGRPLLQCISEGARIISVLVSNRRRDNVIKLVPLDDANEEGRDDDDYDDEENEDNDLSIYFDKSTNASFRWKRFNTNDPVYIDANSVPATAVPVDNPHNLFAVCANTLEVRGGGIRAEGLTLIPQGKAFLLLARFTFGLFQQANLQDGSLAEMALRWIGKEVEMTALDTLEDRIQKAVGFHQSAMDLGETLECYPDKVRQLLDIFDGLDGYAATLWENLSSNPLIRENLAQHRRKLKEDNVRRLYRRVSSADITEDDSGEESVPSRNELDNFPTNPTDDAGNRTDMHIVPDNFSLIELSQPVASTINDLFCGKGDESNIGSCQKLAEVVTKYRRATTGYSKDMDVQSPDWLVYSVQIGSPVAKTWFKAAFTPSDILYTEAKRNAGAWKKKKNHWTARPRTRADAKGCVPPQGYFFNEQRMTYDPNAKNFIFDDPKAAVQMEAAFWLERQFGTKQHHWYERAVSNMVDQLKQRKSAGGKLKQRKKARKREERQQGRQATKKQEVNVAGAGEP